MLSLADHAILKRETALPSLGFLLDDEAFADIVNETWPALKVTQTRGCYLRYKPLTSCLVRYEVTTSHGQELIFAKAYPAKATDKFSKARAKTHSDYHRAVLEKACLILYRFPDDPKLRIKALELKPRQAFFQGLVPGYGKADIEIMTYKPERRLVLKAANGHKRAALKFYAKDDFLSAKRKAESSLALGSIRTPSLLESSEEHGLLAFEWLEGQLMRSMLASEGFHEKQLTQVGASLALLHRQGCNFPTRSPKVVTCHLQNLIEYLSWLQPGLRHRLVKLLEQIDFPREKNVSLHGDFYSKQVLVQENTIAFLDFDEAHQGPAAYDLGLFIAHLEADVLRGLLPLSSLEDNKAHFLQGYEEVAPLPQTLDVHTVRGLLSLLPHFFRNRYPNWPELTETLLAQAEAIVKRSQTRALSLSV
jgi:Ser/Thr protein kinase RdoA (MazF antagonist)